MVRTNDARHTHHLRHLLDSSQRACDDATSAAGSPAGQIAQPPPCGCNFLAAPNSTSAVRAASVEALQPWGLPTARCPAPESLAEYASQHARRKREGRVLVHCESAGGWGNYARSLPLAVLVALILELALVLECDEQITDHDGGRAAGLSHLLPRYFRGPHFDWTAAGTRPPMRHLARAPVATAAAAPVATAAAVPPWPAPPTRVLDLRRKASLAEWDVREWAVPMANRSAPMRVRLLTTGSSTMGPATLLHRRAANIRAARSALGPTLSRFLVVPPHARRGAPPKLLPKLQPANPRSSLAESDGALAGCLMHVVLAPTQHLIRHLAAVPNAPHVGGGGRAAAEPPGALQLHQTVAAHVRTGDAAFQRAPAHDAWRFASVHHMSAFQHSQEGSMRCLQHASVMPLPATAAAGSSARHARTSREGSGGCLGCVVASDSAAVTGCARKLLRAPTLTSGAAVHLAVAPDALASRAESVDKLFLDWWLLARSRVLVQFRAEMLREPRNKSVNPLADPHKWTSATSPNGHGFLSSFVATAQLFRDASSPHGRTVKLSARALLSSHQAARRQCAEHS